MSLLKPCAALLTLAVVVALTLAGDGPKGGDPPKPPEVPVRQPYYRDVVEYEGFKGTIEADQRVDVQPRSNGFLDKVHFKDGSLVKQGEVLFELDSRPAKLAVDKAALELARAEVVLLRLTAEVQRLKELVEKKAASREELDRVQNAREEAAIAVGLARLEVDRTRLEEQYTTIRAPISGRIGRALVGPGNQVAVGTTLTTIIAQDALHVIFEMPDEFLVRYRQLFGKDESKMPAQVAIPGGEEYLPSRLIFIDNKVDPRTRTVYLRAHYDNKQGLALPGMAAGVRIPITPPRKELVVPTTAVEADKFGAFVYTVTDKNLVRKNYVTPGPVFNGDRIIKEGLRTDAWVITEGLQRLLPGLEVRPKKQK